MILRGLESAANGMLSLIEQHDNIANNLANVNTTGYKRTALTFKNIMDSNIYENKGTLLDGETRNLGNLSVGSEVQKLTYDSFVKAFSDIIDEPTYIFLALLLYSNEREKYKNHEMARMLVVDEDSVKSYYIDEIGKELDLDNVTDLSTIRSWAQKELKESIQNNIEVYKSLFTGSSWFDEPYVAHYIYINKKISENKLTDFLITTGSGRSKGNYSIEIKPIIDDEYDD